MACLPDELLKYADTCYQQTSYDESDIYRGDQLLGWVAPIPFGQKRPTIYTLTAGAIAVDDTVATLTAAAGETVTLYRDDLLWFNTSVAAVVVLTTTEVTDAGVAVPIRPQSAPVAANETTQVYPMVPLLSLETGLTVNTSGTISESRNRGQNLFTTKSVYQRSATSEASGTAIRNDVGLAILENASQNNSRVFVEARRPAFDFYGMGLNAKRFTAIVESSSPTSSAQEHSKIQYNLAVTGAAEIYTPLGLTLQDAKLICPDDLFVFNLNEEIC